MNYEKISEITKEELDAFVDLCVHFNVPWKHVDMAWIIYLAQHPDESMPASCPSDERRFFKLAQEMGFVAIKEMGGKGRIWIRKTEPKA